LLGIAEACKIKTVAVVDAAIAAAADCVAPGLYKHIEIQRHRAVITDIIIDELVTRTNIETINGAGFDKLMAQFVAFFADQFLAQSRFDPLHQASTEQLLYNKMPKWLELLHSRREIKVHIEYRGSRFEVRIAKDDIVAVARPIYNNILDHRSLKDRSVIGSRLATMPGFVELRVNQMVLPEAAVFGGCAALAERPTDIKGGVRLLSQLPAVESPAVGNFLESTAQSRPDSRSSTIVPTHVLSGANAYAISATPLYLSSDDSVERVYSKRSLASLRSNGIATYLVAENDAELRLNGRPVSGDTALDAGDEITVKGAGCVYMPINVVSPDAT
ncbi:MAG: hypothetical protein VCB07_03455, partial [Gammaproteobacteria bacterium]